MANKFISSVEIDGSLTQTKHRVIKHTDAVQVLTVTVVTKTASHPEQNNGSSAGFVIDGVEGAYLEFTPGITYKFDQSHSSNANHPLRFYEDAAKNTAYTTGVTTSGTPGSSGAYTQIIPTTATPPILFYQCSAHSLMGSYVKFGTGAAGVSYTPLAVTKNGSNQFPVVFANAENFSLSCAGTWSITATIASGDVGKTGTIIITNTATTTPGSLPSTFKTPNGDTVVFQTDNGDVSILSYLVVSTSIVLVNYVGNFS